MNYCEKHKQKYQCPRCPICIGEKIIDFTHPESSDIMEKACKEYDEENQSNGLILEEEF